MLGTTYSMEVARSQELGGMGWTSFVLYNPSTLLVRAKVWANFRLYGERVDYHPDFNGVATWRLFPGQKTIGGFEIAKLLDQKGKTIAGMLSERTNANAREQLTMDLEMEFRDELGERRRLPARTTYFDFQHWDWVPILTVGGEWED